VQRERHINSTERRNLENQLMVMGLGGLDSPELPSQMAMLISLQGDKYPDGKHAFYAGMLGECDAQTRREMYEAIRPHLMFEPWPLDKYIEYVKRKSSEKESKASPISIGEQQYQEATQEQAVGVVAEFTCRKCTFTKRYLGTTLVDAVIMGRKDGWVKDLVMNKEMCPKCSKALLQ
jgi:hypothetical protein